MSVSKTSVDNDQEAPGAFSGARRASPSPFFKRLLKRDSILKVETGCSYRHSAGPWEEAWFSACLTACATDAESHPNPSGFCR